MDQTQLIVNNLKAMAIIERKNKQPFKARAYDKVVKQLELLDPPILNIDDLDGIEGIGKGIKQKIVTLFETGVLNAAKPALDNIENEKIIESLTQIMGIGVIKARELVEQHGIKDIDTLRLQSNLLNDKQRLGLKYHDDFMKRIPRKEMERHNDFIKNVLPDGLVFEMAGSYRRGLPTSGDIDVLVTTDVRGGAKSSSEVQASFKHLVQALKKQHYLIDDFAFGDEKYMGIARLPRFRTHRRIDIMYIPRDIFAFALLYFTGSQKFNIAMRNHALDKGYSLSEHGFKNIKGPKKGEFVTDHIFETEEDIFDFIEYPYKTPVERIM